MRGSRATGIVRPATGPMRSSITCPGTGRCRATSRVKEAFLDTYSERFGELGGTIEVVAVHDILASDDHAVVLVTERAIRGERSLEFNRVVIYHLRDDRIVETWSYDYDPPALDVFWS